jgi:hypothetical protein
LGDHAPAAAGYQLVGFLLFMLWVWCDKVPMLQRLLMSKAVCMLGQLPQCLCSNLCAMAGIFCTLAAQQQQQQQQISLATANNELAAMTFVCCFLCLRSCSHPAGLLYAGSLWLSNSSYLYLSVSFIQMTKSLMPGLVYGCGCLVGTEVFKPAVALNMGLIAVGVVVCALGEVNLVLLGLLEQLTALGFEVRAAHSSC